MAYRKISGVYKIENSKNHKIYIGSSNSIKKRWAQHKRELRNQTHRNSYLQNAWNAYGEECFKFSIIEKCDVDDLQEKEQFWIDYYKSFDREYGYNICPKAFSLQGIKLTEECKKQISESIRKKLNDPNSDYKEKNLKQVSNLTKSMIEQYGVEFYVCANKLSKEDVLDIYKRGNNGEKPKDLAIEYDVTEYNVYCILSGKSWSHTTGATYNKKFQCLHKDSVLKIVELYDSGKSIDEIAELFNVKVYTIRNILRGKTWSNVTGIKPRKLEKSSRAFKIIQLDMNGEYIREWSSSDKLHEFDNQYDARSVRRACKEQIPYKGYRWVYKKDYMQIND